MTLSETASIAFPEARAIDAAIPQQFFNICLGLGFNPHEKIVWVYLKNTTWGAPGPLTQDAVDFLSREMIQYVEPHE